MLDAMGNDDELAFANYGFMIAKLHAQHAFDHEEQFVFNVVMVPDEFAFDLDDLHRAVVDNAQQALIPKIGEGAEFFLKIYGLNGILQIPRAARAVIRRAIFRARPSIPRAKARILWRRAREDTN